MEKMNIFLILALVIPMLIVASIAFIHLDRNGLPAGSGEDNGEELENASVALNATVIIDFNGEIFTFHNVSTNYTSAYGLLLEACSPALGNFTVSATYYSAFDSLFVERLGYRSNGDDNMYWQYYVNGEMPWVGADKYFLSNGDTLMWKFEEMAF